MGKINFSAKWFKVCCFVFFTASYNELHELQERIARLRAVSFSSDLVRECTRARALSGEAARREKRGRAWSFAFLGRFARRTKKKERLLVV